MLFSNAWKVIRISEATMSLENTNFKREEISQLSVKELVEIILIQQDIIQYLKQEINCKDSGQE